ncbi:MAG: 4-hydroxybenzoate octaprenyltransferase [Deltaproteobacteria bacterium]|nr:4-hydroxybenzoate octaprenyltransferase [Deltaproteobacteria bacterium]
MVRQGLDRSAGVADRQLTWVDRLPEGLRPFAVLARWDRPIGTWLLLWPCWWALALAPGWPDLRLLALFAIGAVAMRGAGCVINDLADRDLDARVERTRHRPLASGELTIGQALAFLALQLLVGLLVLLSFNPSTILLGFASLPLVIAYPFMKRITWWPQAFLGLTFNWGALVGWSAVTGDLAAPALTLYVAGFFWTLGYDTIYAHQDKVDDALIGVKSSARWLGDATPRWLWIFYGVALLLIGVAGWLAGMRLGFFLVLVAAGVHLAWQVRTLDLDDVGSCLVRFRSNREFGWLVFLALLAGKVGP